MPIGAWDAPLLGSRPYSSHFTRSRLATVVPMGSAVRHLIPDWSYVLGHVEFLMQGTMLWTGTGIHLGNHYSCRVVCVVCPLSSEEDP